MTIDYEGPEPLYKQLADIIASQIGRGELAADRPIPSETRLADEYGLARMTVRRTVRELTERGLVRPVSGRGTFVRRRDDSGA